MCESLKPTSIFWEWFFRLSV